MARIKLASKPLSEVQTPSAGQVEVFANSENGDRLTMIDDQGTVYDLTDTGGSGVIESEYAAGGALNIDGINWLWFQGSAWEDYMTNSQTVQLSVQSFIVDSVEQIGTPSVQQFSSTTDDYTLYAFLATDKSFRPIYNTDAAGASHRIVTPVDWVNHLNELGKDIGFKFIGNDNSDKIYFPDVDWSIIIRREFDPGPDELVDTMQFIEYRYSYDSTTKAATLETRTSPYSGGFSSLPYNPYDVPYPEVTPIW